MKPRPVKAGEIEQPDANTDNTVQVVVPLAVYNGINAVRDSGKTNMFDLHMVARLAMQMGFHEGAFWLSDPANRRTYAEGIFRGFKPEDDGGPK